MNLQITNVPLPVRLVYESPLSDEELLRFSAGNEVVWIEREADGTLYVKPISDTATGGRIAHVNHDLYVWAEKDGRGDCCGGTGFLLADGSMRGAPVTWVLKERMAGLSKDEREGFLQFAPDFVVEVLSTFEDAADLRRKMGQWMANGVQVAWLIEAKERRVTVYRAGEEMEVLVDPSSVEGSGCVRGFELVMARVWS